MENQANAKKSDLNHGTFEKKILELCKEGKVLMAVKYVKDTKGWGLKESKEYVDSLCAANGIARSSGCSGKAAIMLLCFAVIISAVILVFK